MSQWDGESNEDVYEKFGIGVTARGVDFGVGEQVKPSTLKLCEDVVIMNEDDLFRQVYDGMIQGTSIVKWINRVNEYCRQRDLAVEG